jgi:hypothetical protein
MPGSSTGPFRNTGLEHLHWMSNKRHALSVLYVRSFPSWHGIIFCVLLLYHAPDSLHFSLLSAILRRTVHKYKIPMRPSWDVDISQCSVGVIGPNSMKSTGHVERREIFIIIINIKDRTLWSVPSPQLQLLAPTLLRSSNCSPSLRSVMLWFQRDSVLRRSLQVWKPGVL